jgi:hypothetical protein
LLHRRADNGPPCATPPTAAAPPPLHGDSCGSDRPRRLPACLQASASGPAAYRVPAASPPAAWRSSGVGRRGFHVCALLPPHTLHGDSCGCAPDCRAAAVLPCCRAAVLPPCCRAAVLPCYRAVALLAAVLRGAAVLPCCSAACCHAAAAVLLAACCRAAMLPCCLPPCCCASCCHAAVLPCCRAAVLLCCRAAVLYQCIKSRQHYQVICIPLSNS